MSSKYLEIRRDGHSSDEDDVIMDNLGEDRVCAVVFSAEGGNRAINLLRDLPLKDSHVKEYRVQDKTHLNTIPRCKSYLMFVDYNTENVILESDTAMQGILLLSTVRQLQAVKGSQMALVYFDDSGAVPPSGRLYSDHVINKGHPIVLDLCHKGRFFSVRYKWNSQQSDSLKTWLPVASIDRDRMALQIDSALHKGIRYRQEKIGAAICIGVLAIVVVALVLFLTLYYKW